jgi:hypothetical protein
MRLVLLDPTTLAYDTSHKILPEQTFVVRRKRKRRFLAVCGVAAMASGWEHRREGEHFEIGGNVGQIALSFIGRTFYIGFKLMTQVTQLAIPNECRVTLRRIREEAEPVPSVLGASAGCKLPPLGFHISPTSLLRLAFFSFHLEKLKLQPK